MSSSLAYFAGSWVPSSELRIPLDDLGFQMGVTIVERLRTFQGIPFRKAEHLDRFRSSLEIVGWNAESIVGEVATTIDDLVSRNANLMDPGDDWFVVTLATPGKTADASKPTICVHGGPLNFASWAHEFEQGVRVATVGTRQVPDNCWPTNVKCRSRLHYYLADREAAQKSPGARAILLDQEGYVGEASTANVVAYYPDRGLVTPHRHKVLPGVTQQVLFELAREVGVPTAEADFTPDELAAAAEILLTSTSVCLLPVVQINDHPVGSGCPGPMFEKLMTAWMEHTGVDVVQQAKRFSQRTVS